MDPSLVYYIEAIASEGRHMFMKSPFRKANIKERLYNELPKSIDLMAFAFPDGNEGDHSSDSEDEAKPQILQIEKLSQS